MILSGIAVVFRHALMLILVFQGPGPVFRLLPSTDPSISECCPNCISTKVSCCCCCTPDSEVPEPGPENPNQDQDRGDPGGKTRLPSCPKGCPMGACCCGQSLMPALVQAIFKLNDLSPLAYVWRDAPRLLPTSPPQDFFQPPRL